MDSNAECVFVNLFIKGPCFREKKNTPNQKTKPKEISSVCDCHVPAGRVVACSRLTLLNRQLRRAPFEFCQGPQRLPLADGVK